MPEAPFILWAEDNPQDRMLIEEAVEGIDGHPRVQLVADGVFLLEALASGLPGLVVLDLKMPRLGGLETLRRIRDSVAWQALPVVIFSSGNRPDEIEMCQSLGVKEVVQKAVDFEVFSADVRRIVRAARPEMFGAAAAQPEMSGGKGQSSVPVPHGVSR